MTKHAMKLGGSIKTNSLDIFVTAFKKITEVGISFFWRFAIFMGVAPDMYWLSTDFSKLLDSGKLSCINSADSDHADMFCTDRFSPVTHRSLVHLYVMIYVCFVTVFLVIMRLLDGFFGQRDDAERHILKRKRKSKSEDADIEYRLVYGFHYIGCITLTALAFLARLLLLHIISQLAINQTNGVSMYSFIERWYCPGASNDAHTIRDSIQAEYKHHLPARVKPVSDLEKLVAANRWVSSVFFRINTNATLYDLVPETDDHVLKSIFYEIDGTIKSGKNGGGLVTCFVDKWADRTLVLRYLYAMITLSAFILALNLLKELGSFCYKCCSMSDADNDSTLPHNFTCNLNEGNALNEIRRKVEPIAPGYDAFCTSVDTNNNYPNLQASERAYRDSPADHTKLNQVSFSPHVPPPFGNPSTPYKSDILPSQRYADKNTQPRMGSSIHNSATLEVR